MDVNIQKQSLRMLCLLAVLITLPFLVIHVIEQNMKMVFSDLLLLFCSLGVLFFGMRTDNYSHALVMQITIMTAALSYSFYRDSGAELCWFFPLTLLPFYVLGKKLASQVAVVLCVIVVAMSWQKMEPWILAQVFGAMLLLLVLGYRMASKTEDQNKLLKKKAHTDSLTGVGNRLGLDQRLIYYVNKFEVEKMPSTLLMLDIDHFGQMVENYGHGYGDQVVTELAGLLNESTRIDDEVFRYGGDVFVVVLRGTSLAESGIPAERISNKINGYKKGRIGNISINMGLAELEEFDNYISWLSRADEALFDAKEMRNREEHATKNAIVKKNAGIEKIESGPRAPAPRDVVVDI
jgi:diguanylate cyclase (GGDEF)-like protein